LVSIQPNRARYIFARRVRFLGFFRAAAASDFDAVALPFLAGFLPGEALPPSFE
jgi:hypothetical protein